MCVFAKYENIGCIVPDLPPVDLLRVLDLVGKDAIPRYVKYNSWNVGPVFHLRKCQLGSASGLAYHAVLCSLDYVLMACLKTWFLDQKHAAEKRSSDLMGHDFNHSHLC